MTSIGIIGTGISGLTLAASLQQHGAECVMYADRTADEIRDGRLPNTVVRYGATIPRERALGLNHRDGADLVIRLVHDHAPGIFDRITEAEFHLTGPLDLLQGVVTPTVRQAWRELGPGRFAIALGDASIVNDPVTGQGANLGSACAAELAALIVEHDNCDEMFRHKAERRLWALAEPVCQFTNAFLEPPPPRVLGVLGAATEDQSVADAFVTNFGDAAAMCRSLATEEAAAAFLQSARDGWAVSV